MDVDGSPRELSADGECEQRSSESESNHGSDVEGMPRNKLWGINRVLGRKIFGESWQKFLLKS
jgi:hypothetical protein